MEVQVLLVIHSASMVNWKLLWDALIEVRPLVLLYATSFVSTESYAVVIGVTVGVMAAFIVTLFIAILVVVFIVIRNKRMHRHDGSLTVNEDIFIDWHCLC